jgi:hypothetical protein
MALDYDHAILAHSRWKKRLQSLIDGSSLEKLDVETVRRDDQCDLGRWMQTVSPPFARTETSTSS